MTPLKTLPFAAAIALLVGTGMSFAQTTPAPAPATPAPAAEPATPMKASPNKKAASKECYSEADQQKLHGKARKKFHSECMKKAVM